MAKARTSRAGKKRKVTKKSKPKKSLKKRVKKTAVKKAPAKKQTVKRPAKPAVVKAKKPAKAKPAAPKPVQTVPPGEQPIGLVIHYYSHLNVAVVKLDRGPLQVGDVVHIKGHTTDFRQVVESMQVEHASVTKAVPGDDFGLKVKDHAREHDVVYKVLNP
jgi:putative protease